LLALPGCGPGSESKSTYVPKPGEQEVVLHVEGMH
jgi:hypothetical protein